MNINQKLFTDFHEFCMPYMHCWDIDPVYPILHEVQHRRAMGNPSGREQAIWHTFLYWVWYHMGSAEYMLNRYPEPTAVVHIEKPLPTGTERRGMRGYKGSIKAIQLIQWVGLNGWLDRMDEVLSSSSAQGKQGWTWLFDEVQKLPNCGPWAGYKWCDLCKNVLEYDITAPNIGVGGMGENAGPVSGMMQLTGIDWRTCASDYRIQTQLYSYCHDQGIPFDGLEEMETALCDFNSLTHGRYYVGHDIDHQQEQFIVMNVPQIYWDARLLCFPDSTLGELQGWHGIRKELNGLYQRTGQIFKGGKA